jgi:hypothetical protein
MELEQQLRAALAPCSSETGVRAAVLARLSAAASSSSSARLSRARSLRRLTLIGGFLALAAAAGALMWYWGHSSPAAAASVTTTVAEPVLTPIAAIAAPGISAKAAEAEASQLAPPMVNLPLVPPPSAPPPNVAQSSLALQIAVQRHPELVNGPQLDRTSTFFVSVAMRANGTVINSAAELASPATSTEVEGRLARVLPVHEGEDLSTYFVKGQQLPDGSALRAQVFLRAALIPDNFDLARSDVRVREILGPKYDDLMTAVGSGESNLLTIFLADDGAILREKVEQVTVQNGAVVLGLGTGERLEESIAAKLGLDVEQIGRAGTTGLEQGIPRMVVDQNGLKRVEGVRILSVHYAWARQMEEPAAVRTPQHAEGPQEDFDLAAALVVAEKLFPDAFSHSPPSLADLQPTVVFSARGEVIRAGRVRIRYGVESDSLLQEQLVPGVPTVLHRWVLLTNKEGATARVGFAWAE